MKNNNEKILRKPTVLKLVNGKLEQYIPKRLTDDGNLERSGSKLITRQSQRKIIKAIDFAQKKSDRVSFTGMPGKLLNPQTKEMDNIINGINGALILKVRKGMRISEKHYCAQCKKFSNGLWRYQNSNYGLVYLCHICKITAFERTYGHADAMPLKVDHAHSHKGRW